MDDYDKLQSQILNKYLWPNLIKLVIIFGLLFGAGLVFLAKGASDNPIDADTEIKVHGLVCPSCALGIKIFFRKEINVKRIVFDTKKQLVLVDYVERDGKIFYLKNDKIIALIEKAGYEVESIKRLDNKKPNRYNKP